MLHPSPFGTKNGYNSLGRKIKCEIAVYSAKFCLLLVQGSNNSVLSDPTSQGPQVRPIESPNVKITNSKLDKAVISHKTINLNRRSNHS